MIDDAKEQGDYRVRTPVRAKYSICQAVRIVADISDHGIRIGDLVVIRDVENGEASNGDAYFYHTGNYPYMSVCNDEIEPIGEL